MLVNLRRLRQSGDTMVEVLMAIAVVSAILGGAYVTVNRSTLATRDAQEHVDALKLASSQLELLNAQPPSTAPTAPFCYTPDSAVPPSYATQAVSGSNCTLTSKGIPAPAGFQPAYNVKDTYNAGTQLYTVQISWASVTGGNGQVQMFYRTDK